ncbi:hypothetical protein AB836_00540 [Rickettsiales bacterium (ex Bugula neritina AB1)]|nr:hypothetical protein AB836_00540 [Rickettsiales bacterium (ex Bugula neritina AB1)]
MKTIIITDNYRKNFKKIIDVLLNDSKNIVNVIHTITNPILKKEIKKFCDNFSNGCSISESLQLSLENKILKKLSSFMLLYETIHYVDKLYELEKKCMSSYLYPYCLFLGTIIVIYMGKKILKIKINIYLFFLYFITINIGIYYFINFFINRMYNKYIFHQKHLLFLRKQINLSVINEELIKDIINIGIDEYPKKIMNNLEKQWDFLFSFVSVSTLILVLQNIIFICIFLWLTLHQFMDILHI